MARKQYRIIPDIPLRDQFTNYRASGYKKELKKTYNSSEYRKDTCLPDIYLYYKYKTRNQIGNTVPLPYFPKSEITDHKFSLTYPEWRRIITIYTKILTEELFNGFSVEMPNKLGTLSLVKVKTSSVDYKRTNKYIGNQKGKEDKEFIFHDNLITAGYRLILKWQRRRAMDYTNIWKFRIPMRTFRKLKSTYIDTRQSPITNFNSK